MHIISAVPMIKYHDDACAWSPTVVLLIRQKSVSPPLALPDHFCGIAVGRLHEGDGRQSLRLVRGPLVVALVELNLDEVSRLRRR